MLGGPWPVISIILIVIDTGVHSPAFQHARYALGPSCANPATLSSPVEHELVLPAMINQVPQGSVQELDLQPCISVRFVMYVRCSRWYGVEGSACRSDHGSDRSRCSNRIAITCNSLLQQMSAHLSFLTTKYAMPRGIPGQELKSTTSRTEPSYGGCKYSEFKHDSRKQGINRQLRCHKICPFKATLVVFLH